jgi:hypothetical protein
MLEVIDRPGLKIKVTVQTSENENVALCTESTQFSITLVCVCIDGYLIA